MKFEEKLAMSMRRSWEEYYLDYKVSSARWGVIGAMP
jgi:hypothetical protein